MGERAADLADDYDNSDHGDSSDNGTDQRPRRSSPSSFPPIPIATRSPRVFLALEGAEPALFLSKHSPRHAAATHVIANGVKDTAIAAKASVSKPESTSIPPIEGGSGALPSSEMDGVFVIYSGGKLEYRKGHDLLIAAFAKFILVHPSVDIKLMVSWHSLWKKARFETSMLYSAYTRVGT